MCGEHRHLPFLASRLLGSSPHVRGAQQLRVGHGDTAGIIPACAGSTSTGAAILSQWRDHPRMCGEHGAGLDQADCRLGSSPHVRGAPMQNSLRCSVSGIIPACAGSTDGFRRIVRAGGDHPRMCGEHLRQSYPTAFSAGSSPHVRGALDADGRVVAFIGIIPACAGSTSVQFVEPFPLWDHPRMCGEHSDVAIIKGTLMGSSPHVRGAPTVVDCHEGGERIIPACAGSTKGNKAIDTLDEGSSPHVRGALWP